MRLVPNENFLRVALVVFSLIFGLLSISLIVLGIVYVDELWWPKRYIGLDFLELPTLLIVLGAISLAMSIAGCLCAKTDNRKLLLSFGVVLLIILGLELAVAIIAFINFDKHSGSHTPTHRIMFEERYRGDEDARIFLKELEDHYNCCGIAGKERHCLPDSWHPPPLMKKGCAEVVNAKIQSAASQIGYFSIVLTLLQIVQLASVYCIMEFIKTTTTV